jgi:purine nucleosidase
VPVLLDTDIGSDIDDALALAYVLAHPRCELLGITVVTGAVERRAACADAVCRAAGRTDVPIRLGQRDPLAMGPGQPDVPQFEAIRSRVGRTLYEAGAVEFLRDVIRARPGEVTLLSIGPFTNVATLFALDPEIPGLLGGLVSMAGIFFQPGRRDWNSLVDPVAAAITYRRGPVGHVSVGLDVSCECVLSKARARRVLGADHLAPVLEMADVWFALERRPAIVLHDPLAAAVVVEPWLCDYAGGEVTVELGDVGNGPGGTRFVPASTGAPRHLVARSVDASAAVEEIVATLGRPPARGSSRGRVGAA